MRDNSLCTGVKFREKLRMGSVLLSILSGCHAIGKQEIAIEAGSGAQTNIEGHLIDGYVCLAQQPSRFS